MGRERDGSGRTVQNVGKRPWGLIIVAAVVAAALGALTAMLVLDSGQQAASGPPGGVEEIEVPSRNHVEGRLSYAQNPPVGGNHSPVWQNSGFYDEPIRDENAVHTMEHGAVWITYSQDLPGKQKETLQNLVERQTCVLASPYPDLAAPIVASAWGKQLKLEEAEDPDLERFVRSYQQGPQTPEPGAACSGGVGAPGT